MIEIACSNVTTETSPEVFPMLVCKACSLQYAALEKRDVSMVMVPTTMLVVVMVMVVVMLVVMVVVML